MIECTYFSALESLGFGSYKEDAMAVLEEAKQVAAKKRTKRSRLENLGIPEEELLRQQQELFEKVTIIINVDFSRNSISNVWVIESAFYIRPSSFGENFGDICFFSFDSSGCVILYSNYVLLPLLNFILAN